MTNALTDARFTVPPVPAAQSDMAWLRSAVARFSSGEPHRRRRALAVAELAAVPPATLRASACAAGPWHRDLPVALLAGALGLDVDPGDVVAAARHYQPHTGDGHAADAAVQRLVTACGGIADEHTAARIGLLVQACVATADLAESVLRRPGPVEEVVVLVLREEPPVRATRRVGPDGAEVVVDLAGAGLPFGAGEHACPGREHALALVAGIAEGVRSR
ncbi:hypothetical protein [Prauserella muralis]|uniref:Uncharacterized protein n=1 Tax=Prauserella muralis TaxID=588067 RepID=A0A2V4B6E1_9PSEU|nr:hypothetical protein [Prauserella muralis]PXY30965.1 hypothetical protein BAY60_00595 [Prauserella muralis]TWE14775.1 hypothetical protein FHX69_6934 [Prauserella muralis]